MAETDVVAHFERERPRLRAMAYRMLGSASDTDDAVQETWIRLQRNVDTIENLGGWLTTVLTRICLNVLRGRRQRAEDPLDTYVPDPLVTAAQDDPAAEVLLDEQVGLALMVVFHELAPAERVAFVLHDVFGVPFGEVAAMLGRTPAAVRQSASRARRRVHASAPVPDTGPRAQREVVDAFFAAGRAGDVARLVAALDPDVVLRADLGPAGGASSVTRGSHAVAARARMFARSQAVVPVLVNGAAGAVVVDGGRPRSVMAFTVVAGRIVRIDVLADPARLERLDLSAVSAWSPAGRDR